MTAVTSDNRLRYGCLSKIASNNRMRYSNSRVQSATNRLRFSCTRQVQSRNLLRFASMTQAYENAWQTGATGTGSTPGSMPQMSIKVEGVELCPAPSILQITLGENQAASWELRITDPMGYYHPKSSWSPWAGKLTKNKTIVIRVTWEGAEFNFVGKSTTNCSHARSWSNAGQFELAWKGLDLSSALFRTGVTMASLRSSNAGMVTTKSAIADLLTTLGISYNLDMMEDSLIRVQHRQDGRPGDWFQQLCDVLWHKWQFRGSTLYVYKPNYAGPPTWRYGAGQALILADDASGESPVMVNSVTTRRAQETNGGKPPVTHDAFGQFTETFNPPIDGVRWRKLAQQGGNFSDFRLYSQGSLVAVREAKGTFPGGLAAANPGSIDKIVYTWGNLPGSIATGAYGKIQFLGAAQDAADLGMAADQVRSLTRVNATSIAAGADLNHQELPANALIADSLGLERHADGYLVEQAAHDDPQNFQIPLNLLMAPGQKMEVDDDRLATLENRYIRQHTLSISTDPAQRFSRVSTILFDPSLTLEDGA